MPVSEGDKVGEDLSIEFSKIGVIETPYEKTAPYQPFENDENNFRIKVDPQYESGLYMLDSFKYIYLLYYIDRLNEKEDLIFNPEWAEEIRVGIFERNSSSRYKALYKRSGYKSGSQFRMVERIG